MFNKLAYLISFRKRIPEQHDEGKYKKLLENKAESLGETRACKVRDPIKVPHKKRGGGKQFIRQI